MKIRQAIAGRGRCGGSSPSHKPAGRDRGQATVEFALVSMTLLLFIIGTLDLGRAVYYYNVLANAARDGARKASVTSRDDWSTDGNAPGTYATAAPFVGTTTIVGATTRRLVGMDPAELQVTITTGGTLAGASLPVTVITQYTYRPVAGTLLGVGPIALTAQSTMRTQ